jgi:hypothetical protein
MSKKNRVVPKTGNVKDAAFAYVSTCCNSIATKPACAVPQGGEIGTRIGSVPDPDTRNTTLGSWRCGSCRKRCKVTRMKNEKNATQDTAGSK